MDNQLSTTLQSLAPSLAAGETALQPADYPLRSIGPGHHLINSKLKPPHTAAACVERRNLIALVTRASRKRLLLLSAPIGSGKTTLLSQWYRHTLPTRSLAWLSLDEQDGEPMRFFVYLAGAVSSAIGDFEACVAGHLPGSGAMPLDPAATAFAETLCRIEQELTIVLDDFQWIGDPALTRAFCFLLQRSPPNIHWIVAGRCMPGLDLSRLRLQDQLAIIDGADLSFSVASIVQLSRKLCRHGLSPQEATRVRNCTEGWVAGVKLALLSAADPADSTDPLDRFAGSQYEVARYLATTVLQEQTPAMRDFLIGSCIVERMNGDLCNALCAIANGQALLEDLEAAQLFIQPLDSHRHWYRYHTLFLDFLRSQLRRDAGERICELHLRASHWFAEHQMDAEALHHAFEAANRDWCVELIAGTAHAWLKCGKTREILRWTTRLSHAEMLSRPEIYTAYIASLILSRRFAEAAEALREVENLTSVEAERVQSRIQVRTLNIMLAILADSDSQIDISDLDASASRLADTFIAGTAITVHAYWLLRRNQFDAARRFAMRAQDVLRDSESPYAVGYAQMVACLADRAQGDMKAAAESCERMFAAVGNGRGDPAWVNAATALAHVRYEQNRPAEAEALCTEVLPLLCLASTLENFTTAYLTLARVRAIDGRHVEALQLIDYLHSMLESGSHPRFLAQVCYEKIRLHLLMHNPQRAHAVAVDFGLPALASQSYWQPRTYDEAWEQLGFSQAALLMEGARYDECTALLDVLRSSAAQAGYVYRQVPLEAALACSHWCAGNRARAFDAMNRGFVLTRRFGFPRSVFDEAPLLREVIAAAVQDRKLCLLPAKYFSKFQDVFAVPPERMLPAQAKPKPTLPLEPLTDREIGMLRLLSQGLSNLEISAHSRIALSTAKWHLKNAFAKLDVGTRTGAIARARALQLIE